MRRWFTLALLCACAHHEPALPPPQTYEQQRAAEIERKQRDYFEEYHTAQRLDCGRRCTLAHEVCSKARRICEITEANPQDQGLTAYCSVASNRCEKADRQLRFECRCWSTGPRVD
ncbi:MAG TPA: hypothetical protein VKN99_09645 [Polyangia bacterium]|nr:hypothetical protein [Polyangia bacterium]